MRISMKKIIVSGIAVLALAIPHSSSFGAVIADWDFTGSSGTIVDISGMEKSMISSTLSGAAANITSTDLIKSAGLNRTAGGGGSLTDELNLSSFGGTASDASSTLFFTLAADSGFTIDIDSIAVSAFRNGAGAPADTQFLVSIDGGALATYDASQGFALSSPNFLTHTFTESIVGATSVAIHYAPFGSGGNVHVNDIVVNGSVIPEPATFGLVALFGGGILFIRRKQMI